ncbi:DUF202 domain-containing protein [Streptomyces sp. DSM 44915]|uniref:DUF202 domain-containing protein n=1 Tax=Streptomyces chisholmiae TaxID=3075540 RepID=A0ABU2K007_9ACTN|nr:DUF202 domain-containing protein [Streptomyces sp. DSM 44915]MDT0269798.1 DUF202 domain-containing protein [Streptomyces sp. DSM 44915]
MGRVREAVRWWFSPRLMRNEGPTPDYRYSLANERTFLAWLRTSLALLAGGIAVQQFLTELPWAPRMVLALLLVLGGAFCAVRAIHHWVRTERAIRRGEDLPLSRFPAALSVGTVLLALLLVGALLWPR